MKNRQFPNNTRNLWALLALTALLALSLNGCCPAKPKVYHVGIIKGGSFAVIADGFVAEMTELGYVEGENIIYNMIDGGVDLSDAPSAAAQLVADNVDLIFAAGSTPASLAAKAATEGTDVPVVFAYAAVEDSGLIDTVRQPGGNITGVRYPGHETMARRLEILQEIMPEVERVWIGYDVNNPNTDPSLESLRSKAPTLGITLVEVPATTFEELEADLAARSAAKDPGIDAMILMADGFNASPPYLAVLCKFAKENQIPLGGSFIYTVEAGALYGNANDLIEVGKLAAPIAKKVLEGTPAGTIPVITPEQDIYINYAVAQELGLTVPESLLEQATEIIR
jgi:putative ABC transport system substrate-binding protein